MLVNRNQICIKNIIHHNQIDFITLLCGSFNICKHIKVINHKNELNDKNHMTISIDAGRTFGKIQHASRINVLLRVGLEEYTST